MRRLSKGSRRQTSCSMAYHSTSAISHFEDTFPVEVALADFGHHLLASRRSMSLEWMTGIRSAILSIHEITSPPRVAPSSVDLGRGRQGHSPHRSGRGRSVAGTARAPKLWL